MILRKPASGSSYARTCHQCAICILVVRLHSMLANTKKPRYPVILIKLTHLIALMIIKWKSVKLKPFSSLGYHLAQIFISKREDACFRTRILYLLYILYNTQSFLCLDIYQQIIAIYLQMQRIDFQNPRPALPYKTSQIATTFHKLCRCISLLPTFVTMHCNWSLKLSSRGPVSLLQVARPVISIAPQQIVRVTKRQSLHNTKNNTLNIATPTESPAESSKPPQYATILPDYRRSHSQQSTRRLLYFRFKNF